MKLTLMENINTESIVLRHKILMQAIGLINGREGALETEKDLYLILALLNNIIEEDLVSECNDDARELVEIMEDELEPYFFELMKKPEYLDLFNYTHKIFINECNTIWNNQHSIMGVIDTVLTLLGTMDDTEKGKILESTAQMAQAVYEKRTEKMTEQAEAANSKLEQLVEMYQKKEGQMSKEENNAE